MAGKVSVFDVDLLFGQSFGDLGERARLIAIFHHEHFALHHERPALLEQLQGTVGIVEHQTDNVVVRRVRGSQAPDVDALLGQHVADGSESSGFVFDEDSELGDDFDHKLCELGPRHENTVMKSK